MPHTAAAAAADVAGTGGGFGATAAALEGLAAGRAECPAQHDAAG